MSDDIVVQEELQQSVTNLQSKQEGTKFKNSNRTYNNENYQPYDEPSYGTNEKYNVATGQLFYFDPNTIDEAGWKKLGLRDKTITTIINYRKKGGKFRTADDIKKIWGLHASEAQRLMPFVQITASANANEQRNYSNQFENKPATTKKYASVDINSADTTALISLPGIGSKLSQRIIHFRDKLGGFYSVEQVAETFALPDSTYQKIKPLLQLSGSVRTININSADINELKQHPYIKYPIANAIVQYRNQHGNYSSVNDIKKIMIIDEALYQRVSPYLAVQ